VTASDAYRQRAVGSLGRGNGGPSHAKTPVPDSRAAEHRPRKCEE
jgi:hypothetical protein